ncbi:hypothetical protein PB2503_09229 [Parvularcula bermudensis HTCC2503]|uniref:DUF1761 domain-containing protein n=1 Tax=Parvularcula bermudensis (strain ATCC BAA-594 / HTCC2503 / KCTC 12087) TaxID=314260 RepID=E0TD76_PARBH|nr:DUF1761 domain-containing protein [Parvularcula bermudensis]ADM09899.1 hypothetical protein PB2503_09229 [Parvularcula bermudensis HTCC2503]
MIYIWLNAVPILIAAGLGFAFGAVWYQGFATSWRRAAAVEGTPSADPRILIVTFAAEAWLAAILAGALILMPDQAPLWVMTTMTPLIIWGGFVLPTTLVNHRFQGRPWRLTIIDGGHWLGVMVIQAITMQLIGLSAPPGQGYP